MAEANRVAMPAATNARFCKTESGTRALSPARRSTNRNPTSATADRTNRKMMSGAVQPRSSAQSSASNSASRRDGKRGRSGIVDSCVVFPGRVCRHHKHDDQDRRGCDRQD